MNRKRALEGRRILTSWAGLFNTYFWIDRKTAFVRSPALSFYHSMMITLRATKSSRARFIGINVTQMNLLKTSFRFKGGRTILSPEDCSFEHLCRLL